jgi:hypothetical protein
MPITLSLSLKTALAKSAIVLVPSYAAAYFTGQMVYVVPTLAAAGFFASSIDFGQAVERRVDEDSDESDENSSAGNLDYNNELALEHESS